MASRRPSSRPSSFAIVFDTYEAGLVLLGTEVKAIREGRVNLRDSYGRVEAGEVFLHNLHICVPSAGVRTPCFRQRALRLYRWVRHGTGSSSSSRSPASRRWVRISVRNVVARVH